MPASRLASQLTQLASDACDLTVAQVQLPQFRRAGMEVTAIASRSQDTAVTLAATVRLTLDVDCSTSTTRKLPMSQRWHSKTHSSQALSPNQ